MVEISSSYGLRRKKSTKLMDDELGWSEPMEFTIGFYKELYGQVEKANGIASPLSIAAAMAMAAAGARGQTLEQITSVVKGSSTMQDTLKSLLASAPEPDDPKAPMLCVANGVWAERSINLMEEYKQILENDYGALASPVDFINEAEKCRELINSWVAERTNSRITKLLPKGSVSSSTRVVITNAIYFKAAWKAPLKPSNTRNSLFHLPSGDTKLVPMMQSWEKRNIKNHDSFKVLRLPYRKRFSMYILLPSETQGLPALISNLDDVMGKTFSGSIPLVKVGDFKLPRFKISQEIQVPELLKRMGLELPFSPEHANFSGIAGSSKGLHVSDVFHKAFVEVEEGGTEAAASAASMLCVMASRTKPKPCPVEDFVADHPFLFLIREDLMGVVLFVGHVNDPTLSSAA